MKLEVANPNYCATAIRIRKLVKLEGLDNLVAIPVMGLQALVSKATAEGELGLLFPSECQLDLEEVGSSVS